MLKINDLHKSFGDKEILHGINIHVQPGQIYGFIGHNGAGKTTTLKCVAGILEYEKGDILIDGINLIDNPIACKRKMAYLQDNPDLYDNLTGIQYLNFVADIFGIDANIRKERIETISKELEIYENLGDQIKALSHGMKQKVAIISALIHEPQLLLLDEPFVGLDPKASFILKQKMQQLCDKGGSIFFSSHVLEVVENLCNEIAIIHNGNIVTQGSTSDIVSSGQTLEDVFLSIEGKS